MVRRLRLFCDMIKEIRQIRPLLREHFFYRNYSCWNLWVSDFTGFHEVGFNDDRSRRLGKKHNL